MKQVLFNLLLAFFIGGGVANAATNTLHDKPLKTAPASTDETYVWDTGASTLKKTTFAPFLVGDCTGFPCLDGTSDGGNYIKLWAGTGSYWTALQGGSPAANRSWRLPIAAPPSAGTTYLMNMDEYGQMGFVAPSSFLTPTGSGAALTIDASGFDGNLTTSDNTLQEVSQKVDDLIVGGGGYTNLTEFVGQTAWRLFYSDGSGDVKELALGSDGEYLKSNGAALAPSWATPSGAVHDAVTLGTDADVILGLSTQQITLDSQTANSVFASPNGSAGDPTFRALVAADIPSDMATDTEVTAAINALPNILFGTGLTTSTDTPSAGTDTISVTTNTYQAYDANMILWPSTISATEVQYLDGLPDTLVNLLGGKQATLVSGTNIKTVNNTSLLGSGNIDISGSGSFAFDTFPAYEDSAHSSGIAVNETTLAVYSSTAGKWLTVGLTDTLDATPVDTTPDAFSFTDVTDASLSTEYTALAQINGIAAGITCSGSGGTVAACTGSTSGTCGTFGATTGSITNGQYVGAKVTSSGTASTAANNVVTCSGVSDTFTATTAASAAISDSFTNTDNVTLASHNSNWSAADGGSISNAIIKSNQLYQNSSTPFWAIRTDTTSDTSSAVIKAQAQNTTAVLKGVLVRGSADTTGYYLTMQAVSGGNYTGVLFIQDGVSVGSCLSVINAPLTSDHTLKIVASGTSTVTLKGYVDGTLVCTKTGITSPAQTGHPGVYMGNLVNAGDRYIDDWGIE